MDLIQKYISSSLENLKVSDNKTNRNILINNNNEIYSERNKLNDHIKYAENYFSKISRVLPFSYCDRSGHDMNIETLVRKLILGLKRGFGLDVIISRLQSESIHDMHTSVTESQNDLRMDSSLDEPIYPNNKNEMHHNCQKPKRNKKRKSSDMTNDHLITSSVYDNNNNNNNNIHSKNNKNYSSNSNGNGVNSYYMNKIIDTMNSRFDNDGYINFNSFNSKSDVLPGEETDHTKPLKLEICSGAGEWAVEQVGA